MFIIITIFLVKYKISTYTVHISSFILETSKSQVERYIEHIFTEGKFVFDKFHFNSVNKINL